MKWIVNILAALVTLAGVVFFLQGTNILPVGGMAGQSQWTIIGAIMAIAGVAVLVFLNRRS